MQRLLVCVIVASAGVAFAKPKLVTVGRDKTTMSVPLGYNIAVGERCISVSGAGSLTVIRTTTTQADFEKAEKGKKVVKDKVVCFENTQPGEHARCMVTTDAGRWITQFVAFGKSYSAIGGADTMRAIVASIKGWAGKPYDGTYAVGGDCPAVPLEPLEGTEVAPTAGAGLDGTSYGGGGRGEGTIGLGTGTIGKGSGTGAGYGIGRLRGTGPATKIGAPSANGDLDKAIIRRYIKRNLPKITFCYERELEKTPTLAGTVTAKFTIGPSGKVIQSTASGLGNQTVESCIAGVIHKIEFPKPKGGNVDVNYPFAFRPAPQ